MSFGEEDWVGVGGGEWFFLGRRLGRILGFEEYVFFREGVRFVL